MLAYKIASCEVCIHWRKPIGACKIQCQSPSRRLIELRWSHQDIKLDCFNDNNKETSLYNFTLAREKTTITISKKMRDEDTRDTLRGDGIHLTPRGGEIAAREINKLVANNNNNNNNPKQQTTKVTANIPIPIPETTAESWYIPQKNRQHHHRKRRSEHQKTPGKTLRISPPTRPRERLRWTENNSQRTPTKCKQRQGWNWTNCVQLWSTPTTTKNQSKKRHRMQILQPRILQNGKQVRLCPLETKTKNTTKKQQPCPKHQQTVQKWKKRPTTKKHSNPP